jgi:hypothetical protein
MGCAIPLRITKLTVPNAVNAAWFAADVAETDLVGLVTELFVLEIAVLRLFAPGRATLTGIVTGG